MGGEGEGRRPIHTLACLLRGPQQWKPSRGAPSEDGVEMLGDKDVNNTAPDPLSRRLMDLYYSTKASATVAVAD